MPRPPSAHGLERKFKPWRKGKGRRAPSQDGETEVRVESRGSLKNRLRKTVSLQLIIYFISISC